MATTKRERGRALKGVAAAVICAWAINLTAAAAQTGGAGWTRLAQATGGAPHKAAKPGAGGKAGAAKPAGVPEPEGFWTGDDKAPLPATVRGGKVIHVQPLSKIVLAGDNTLLLDVSNRPVKPGDIPEGQQWQPPLHRGIPGAKWIPAVGMGEVPANVDSFFKERLAALAGNDFERPIVIYCHEKSWLGWNAAKRAISYGYHNVSWFPEGIEGWRATGLATSELQPEKTPQQEADPTPASG
ncbi:MAG TPA: rhodanese-like domain-containing protein [Steroidobacteraceae bacterium]|jgi:PQQ-dependent catabolism-associated CXXCW motif protein